MPDRIVRVDRYTTTDDEGHTRTLVVEVFADGWGSEYTKVATEHLERLLGPKFTKLDD
jgi:hypothetical protein